ncbi:hypothetical protein ABZ470_32470 [Streptosporangium sp. NPDC020072]|uniref:hypothetical protein n=1 Tax=Streptosporangium sp. NPDC020072 TaxID=3154788 RepID=UPI00343E232D
MSTTRRTLWRLRAMLTVAVAALFVTSFWLFQGVHQTADSRAISAILEISSVRQALATADRAAVETFLGTSERGTSEPDTPGPGASGARAPEPGTAEAGVSGSGVPSPGGATLTLPAEQEYREQIQTAGLNLAQAARDDVADDVPGRSDDLQLAQGMLAVYTTLVEQAGEHYRRGDGTVGATYLWGASRLMHHDRQGILKTLDDAQERQWTWLRAQFPSTWAMRTATVCWGLCLLTTLALLCGTQVFLRRRFRRDLNPRLLTATALVLVLAAATSPAYFSGADLDEAGTMTRRVAEARKAGVEAEHDYGDERLARLLDPVCGTPGTCGPTVTKELRVRHDVPPPPVPREAAEIREVNVRMRDATEYAGLVFLIPLLSAAAGALIWGGIHPRLNEYRYRPR